MSTFRRPFIDFQGCEPVWDFAQSLSSPSINFFHQFLHPLTHPCLLKWQQYGNDKGNDKYKYKDKDKHNDKYEQNYSPALTAHPGYSRSKFCLFPVWKKCCALSRAWGISSIFWCVLMLFRHTHIYQKMQDFSHNPKYIRDMNIVA